MSGGRGRQSVCFEVARQSTGFFARPAITYIAAAAAAAAAVPAAAVAAAVAAAAVAAAAAAAVVAAAAAVAALQPSNPPAASLHKSRTWEVVGGGQGLDERARIPVAQAGPPIIYCDVRYGSYGWPRRVHPEYTVARA